MIASPAALRSAACLAPLLLGGCSSTYYVELLVGDWSGVAIEAKGQQLAMSASFAWDEEKADEEENAFSGTVDLDGYVYYVNGLESGKDSADLHLVFSDPLGGEGDLVAVSLNDDQDELSGQFSMNVCPPGTGQDPNICVLTGDFELDLQ